MSDKDKDRQSKSESKGNPGEQFTHLEGDAYMSEDSGEVVRSKEIVKEEKGNKSNGSK
ncbi:competence protein ComE [Fischerella thermalis CCMEE 5273]|jgi:hypothetical protein|nr:competence protein ComE [Fischerella thermalis CCMEE 5273]